MTFEPKILIIREDLFALAGRDYLEALLLHRFLQKDFSVWCPYPYDQFHKDMLLYHIKSSKINKSIQRLIDKGYIDKRYSGFHRAQVNSFLTHHKIVNRDLVRLGYPEYVESHAL
jgi:hypothetical protein